MTVKNPRKAPSKEGAQVTVDAILDAVDESARTVGVEGLKIITIARRAGVSRGTLYQYFSGIESLTAAWEERELQRDATLVMARVLELLARVPPLEEAITDMVELGFSVLARRRQCFRDPRSNAEFLSRLVVRIQIEDNVAHGVAAALANAVDQHRLRTTDYLETARVVVKAVTYLGFDAGSSQPGVDIARFRRETAQMITCYLLRDASP